MLHGIKELSMDGKGYVYWKGNHCEHYSGEAIADPSYAQGLAERCCHAESLNIPIDSGTVVWQWHWVKDFYIGSPYQHLLLNLHTILEKDGRCAILADSSCWEPILVTEFGIEREEWQITHSTEAFYDLSRNLSKLGYVTPDLGQPRHPACPNGIESATRTSYSSIVKYLTAQEVPENLLMPIT